MAEATGPKGFHVIRGVRVRGGFLDGLRVDFDDNLNCIIGGRGTGKTTLLEILRWTLEQIPVTTSGLRRNI